MNNFTPEENMKTIPNYGIWLLWTETPEGNVFVYEGYLDHILLKLGSRYDNIHVKRIKNLDINNETPPYTRAKEVHFCFHDKDFTNFPIDDKFKYLRSMMIGRHVGINKEIVVGSSGDYFYYTLQAHMSEEEKRKEEIQEILNKLNPEDSKRLEKLWKKQYDYEAIRRLKNVKNNKISITKQTE